MATEENILGTERIGVLIRRFAIPSIISLVVNSLYNIVDQIFIGWGVGYLGNGATNIVFPLTVICLAFALIFGDGASSYLSLKLGEQKKGEASKGVGNSICLSVMIAFAYLLFCLLLLPQLLTLFGCTPALREYAFHYGYIITLGFPLMMIGTALNSIIRADGSPKYAMASMIIGALFNILLDPLFIFVFHMGVEGAAIATVLSQIITFAMNVFYLRKMKTISFTKKDFKLQLSVVKKILFLGISSFITQISIVIVIAVQNNLLKKYGADSSFGTEIPITVFGIVMKINQILNSIVIGIAIGTQPIIGYNYGALKYDRVKQTLKVCLTVNVIIGCIAFLLFQTIPEQLISIFGSGDQSYMEFACSTFRIYFMLCICNSIQISAGIFFQAIGKSMKSALLSLSRQILLLVPAFFLLGYFFGLKGLLYAGPVADGLAFLLAFFLLIFEIKQLSRTERQADFQTESQESNHTLNHSIIITIGREYGSGGRYVGKLVAQQLGIPLYDKEFIMKVAEKTGLAVEYIEKEEQKREHLVTMNYGYYAGLTNADQLFIQEANVIKELANKGSCVIVGRCADFVLKDRKDVMKVFLYSNLSGKMKRATTFYGLNPKTAKKQIDKMNQLRAKHYKYYTERNWKSFHHYDICMNTDSLGVEKTADFICNLVRSENDKCFH